MPFPNNDIVISCFFHKLPSNNNLSIIEIPTNNVQSDRKLSNLTTSNWNANRNFDTLKIDTLPKHYRESNFTRVHRLPQLA